MDVAGTRAGAYGTLVKHLISWFKRLTSSAVSGEQIACRGCAMDRQWAGSEDEDHTCSPDHLDKVTPVENAGLVGRWAVAY